MAGEFLVQVKFAAVSGLPADAVINTWAVDMPAAPTTSDFDDAAAAFEDFYNADPGSGDTLAQFMSASLSRVANAVEVAFFDVSADLDGSPHGSPDTIRRFTLGASALQDQLPSEAAVVLSLRSFDMDLFPEDGPVDPAIPSTRDAIRQGAPATHSGTTKPRARRRGRVYIGPLNSASLSDTAPNGEAFVHPDLITRLEDGLVNLNTALDLIPATLSVWSRRDAAFHPLSSISGEQIGFVDNAFDTQRRRGQRALSRTTILVP